jgi:acetyltransferase-like isoleucine patch superfamily enzyme
MVDHSRQCIVEGPVYLEENVGIALNSVILPGVTVEKNSFISINTVVNKNVESNVICKGNPGKIIRNRFIKK